MHIPYESDDSGESQENRETGILWMPEIETGGCQDKKADK